MTGPGRSSDAHPWRADVALPNPRSRIGRLTVIGCRRRPADPMIAAATDRLAAADVVFAAAESEKTVLFYAEAWRVEPFTGAAQIASWFTAHPGATAAIVAPGDPGPLLADLDVLLPGLQIDGADGLTVGPPPRHPLGEYGG